ncbi:MAG: membrane protein insertase YidC [Alphaproteobacteria bacterium]|nr:membrane protein insertase YidC [Alphaproteobacteria bacterium]
MRHTTPPNPSDMRNMIITALLCTGLLFVWQVLYVKPSEEARMAVLKEQAQRQQEVVQTPQGDVILPTNMQAGQTNVAELATEDMSNYSREEMLAATPRITINSPALHGSINLRGLRFDDLTLVRHRVSVEEDSPEVVLLTPSQHASRYFAQGGWLPAVRGSDVKLPDEKSLWSADDSQLTPKNPVTLQWDNGQGVTFLVHITLDKDYLFSMRQEVINNSGKSIDIMPYGLINRSEPSASDRFGAILHSGPIGVFNGELTEVSYDDLRGDEQKQGFSDTHGWLGMADKYWLTAFQHVPPRGRARTQVDFLAKPITINSGAKAQYSLNLFAGAKELDVLEKYREQLNLPLFDRALDFGVLYFLTKPTFMALDYFYGLIGNFGLAIMLFVVMLKIVLFPLSNKSYRSMAQMRILQPKIDAARKRFGDDRMQMQKEVMAIWQREKVNPVSGCLPMLIQIPIFFALYKVLLVTIEMRHAPFYGWIADLSAPDPTNIFTLFGLFEWNPPSLMHIGLWPIIMAATMVLQQKFNPKPTDPMQAKVIGWLPYIFLVMFASFPAGLLIYWAWNNTLSIVQQMYIMRSFEKHKKRKEALLGAEFNDEDSRS